MAKQMRVGVVGCGKIARVRHVPEIEGARGGKVVALCDPVIKRAEALREEQVPNAGVYADFEEMLGADLDAVSICTPNNLHYPMTMAAFKKGLHVICEKPIAGTLGEASRMIAAAKKAGKVLHVNQSLRFNALYLTIADLIQKGKVGEPIHLRCIRGGSSTPDKGWSPGATWFVSKAAQGGLTLDIAIHMADVLRWYAGPAAEIAALVDTRTEGIDVPDNVNALLRFQSGATAVLELSWTLPVGGSLLEIYGTEGRIRTGFTTQPIELTLPAGKGGKPRVSYPAVKKNVKNGFQHFIEEVQGKAPSPTPGELGRDALALCVAIENSAKTGRVAKVKTFSD